MRQRLSANNVYDLAVIGGGVHGAAIAWEAARAGYSVVVLERDDFAAGTSANSLKVIHGGLRYLQSLDLKRARMSAREQRRLLEEMPNLVRLLPCIMPTHRELKKSRTLLALGLWFYQLAINPGGRRGRLVASDEFRRIAGLDPGFDATGAAVWYDAQVYNSERLVLNWLFSARAAGAEVHNYVKVTGLADATTPMLRVQDLLAGAEHDIRARLVVDTADALDGGAPRPRVRGVNLVIRKPLSDHAVGLRIESDQVGGHAPSRLLFLVPWRDTTLAGTWYFEDRRELGTRITRSELELCIRELHQVAPEFRFRESDVRFVHVGRLPVDALVDGVPRLLEKPELVFAAAPVLTVRGVKYTTAGIVARQALDRIRVRLEPSGEAPDTLPYGHIDDWDRFLEGALRDYRLRLPVETITRLSREYGSTFEQIMSHTEDDALQAIPGAAGTVTAEIHHAVEREAARTLTDLMVRRTGLGAAGPPDDAAVRHCAEVMARRLRWTKEDTEAQIHILEQHYQRVVGD